MRLALPHIRKSEAGRIVFITSITVKEPTPHLALSNAIRPGLTGWAKTLARELGPEAITVNCVAPGRIDTPRMTELYGPDGPPAEELAQIPLGRLGSPARVRRRRVLRRLGPGCVHHRHDRPRRRRQLPRAPVKRITPGRLLALGVVLFAVALTLYVVPSNEYIFLPDKAHPVAPLVTVQGGHDPARAASISWT